MELLTPSEAADVAGVHERTLRKWARAGIITRHLGPDGRPGYAREEVSGLSASGPAQGRVGAGLGSLEGRPRAGQEAADLDSPHNNPASHNLSPGAASKEGAKEKHYQRDTEGVPSEHNHRADLAEQKAALLQEERDRLAEELQRIHAQLEVRAEELRRRDSAEEQLRVMLARLEATNAELAGALVQKALPPAPEVTETPRRVRWWAPWRRG